MKRPGFTIIELMVTVMIMTLLLTAAAAGIVRARKVSRDGQRIRDVFTIGTAIEQSTTNARGLYPYNISNKTINTMCAQLIGNAGNNPNGINFGLFVSRAIPTDPLPERNLGSCSNYRDGYTYHNRYGSSNNLARPASGNNYEYVVEVGLETDRPAEEKTLTAGTDTSSASRKQFLLLGKYCATLPTNTCSLP